MSMLPAIIVGSFLVAAAPAAAQPPCFVITAPGARLECYDRAARAPAQASAPRAPHLPLVGICTPSSPCVSPKGGVHHHTRSGRRRHLPRG